MAVIAPSDFGKRMARRKWQGRVFHGLCLLAVGIALAMLAVLLIYIVAQGWSRVDWSFLSNVASRHPDHQILGPAYNLQLQLQKLVLVVVCRGVRFQPFVETVDELLPQLGELL